MLSTDQGNTFYELRQSPIGGTGAFALKDIPAGTCILVDNPLFVIQKAPQQITDGDVENAYARLPPSSKRQFDVMYAMPHLPGSRRLVRFLTNMFEVVGSGASGCFCHASRFNHSCQPNCFMSTTLQQQQQCFVFRDVAAGDELTFSYAETVAMLPSPQRRRYLWEMNGIKCACALCSTPEHERTLSDTRRALMGVVFFVATGRHLQFLEEYVPNVDRDDVLSRAAALGLDPIWPMALFMQLAEAEGLTFGSMPCVISAIAIEALVSRCEGVIEGLQPFSSGLPLGLQFWISRQKEFNVSSRGRGRCRAGSGEEQFEKLCVYAASVVDTLHGMLAYSRAITR